MSRPSLGEREPALGFGTPYLCASPDGFPAEFAANIVVKREAITVRTEPPSGDLASCLGRKATEWSLPKPGRKDPPVVFRATWRWVETTE